MTMIRFSRCVSGAGVAGNGTGADAASPYPPTLASMDVQHAAINGAPADRLPSIKANAAGVPCGVDAAHPHPRMADAYRSSLFASLSLGGSARVGRDARLALDVVARDIGSALR